MKLAALSTNILQVLLLVNVLTFSNWETDELNKNIDNIAEDVPSEISVLKKITAVHKDAFVPGIANSSDVDSVAKKAKKSNSGAGKKKTKITRNMKPPIAPMMTPSASPSNIPSMTPSNYPSASFEHSTVPSETPSLGSVPSATPSIGLTFYPSDYPTVDLSACQTLSTNPVEATYSSPTALRTRLDKLHGASGPPPLMSMPHSMSFQHLGLEPSSVFSTVGGSFSVHSLHASPTWDHNLQGLFEGFNSGSRLDSAHSITLSSPYDTKAVQFTGFINLSEFNVAVPIVSRLGKDGNIMYYDY